MSNRNLQACLFLPNPVGEDCCTGGGGGGLLKPVKAPWVRLGAVVHDAEAPTHSPHAAIISCQDRPKRPVSLRFR
jgi:hypothetical protein